MGVYVVIYRSKDKNTTQDNLAELVGSSVAPIWCKQPSILRVVRSLFITIILRRICYGQSIRKIDSFFEEPFWVGVFERVSDGKLSVCKVTFDSEPNNYEAYDFALKNYYQIRFNMTTAADVKAFGRNPKRVQREVRQQVQNNGIGTKSKQALKLQQEQLKTERKIVSREQREAEKQRQFEMKQQKRKEKHRGK